MCFALCLKTQLLQNNFIKQILSSHFPNFIYHTSLFSAFFFFMFTHFKPYWPWRNWTPNTSQFLETANSSTWLTPFAGKPTNPEPVPNQLLYRATVHLPSHSRPGSRQLGTAARPQSSLKLFRLVDLKLPDLFHPCLLTESTVKACVLPSLLTSQLSSVSAWP